MPTRIGDLLRPLGCSVCETQSVEAAQQALSRTQSEMVIVRDLRDRPVGVLTYEDLKSAKAAHPEAWAHKRCASTVTHMPALLGPEDPIQVCVKYYQDHGVRPVVVFAGQEPVGVLHPTEVFQWCAQRDGDLVEELADRARSTRHRSRPLESAPAGSNP